MENMNLVQQRLNEVNAKLQGYNAKTEIKEWEDVRYISIKVDRAYHYEVSDLMRISFDREILVLTNYEPPVKQVIVRKPRIALTA